MYRHLLARSWDAEALREPPAHARLLPHLRAVQAAGEAIADSGGALILSNLDLDEKTWLPRLRLALSLSGLLHDLGKAYSFFQGMVRDKSDHPSTAQPIRHELLSVLLLLRNCGGLADWLRGRLEETGQGPIGEELFQTVVGAVAGHHVKMEEDWRKAFPAQRQGGGGTSIDLYLGHADLRPLFGEGHPARDETWSLLPSDPTYPGKSQLAFNMASTHWQDYLRANPEWRRFAAAVKALAVAADVAGSALLPEGVSPKTWVANALAKRPTSHQLQAVVTARLQGRSLRPFQRAIAESPARVTLVEAGCGSGKTAAAYLWAAHRAQGRKLFFCYPTTGTATEGFLDYVAESEVEAELIHSRAKVDLEQVAITQEQAGEEEQLRIAHAWGPRLP
jgi:CRISPR-associated endonuclease/helicase Cas3